MLRFFSATVLLVFFAGSYVFACGYSFVGDCSSSISLKINGTTDSFAIAPCPGLLQFDGFAFGSLQSLSITRAKAVTWESCQNNVTGVALFYRVYEQGGSAAPWQNFNLQEDYNTLVGPYTTRYRSANVTLDLTSGLIAGKTYVLEIYLSAAVDTIGDDFIPETSIFQDNNGQNYHLAFQYGGPSAPPFIVAVTKSAGAKCNGDSTGVAGVTVYGDQSGLFYQWSTGGNNFPVLANIPAGTYSVTVTGSNHIDSQTVVITEPMPLGVGFSSVAGPGCSGMPGQATAVPTGGTTPYEFLWDNGQQLETAAFSNGGAHTLTITDGNGCAEIFPVDIPSLPLVAVSISAEICGGEAYSGGGQTFTTTGFFNFTLPGNNGDCDTLVQLTLNVLDPKAAFVLLSDSAIVSCTAPEINLCAAPVPNTAYQWSKDGSLANTTLCLLATAGGEYMLTATTTGTIKTCSESKIISVEEHLLPPAVSAYGTLEYVTHCYDADSVILRMKAVSAADGPLFTWHLDGAVVSQADTCQIISTQLSLPDILFPSVSVQDKYGCKSFPVLPDISIIQPPLPPFLDFYEEPDFCTGLVNVHLDVTGGIPPISIQWGDSLVSLGTSAFPPGSYEAVLTDGNGCTTAYSAELPPVLDAWVNHDAGGGSGEAAVFVPGGTGEYTYLWSNGSTEQNISGLAGGQYCVTVTDILSGCTQDTCLTILVPVTELPRNNLSLSPNPAAPGQWVEISLPPGFVGAGSSLDIYDLYGRKISDVSVRQDSDRLLFRMPEGVLPGFFAIHIHNNKRFSLMGKLLLKRAD